MEGATLNNNLVCDSKASYKFDTMVDIVVYNYLHAFYYITTPSLSIFLCELN